MKNTLIAITCFILVGCSTLTSPEVIAFVSARAGDAASIAVAADLQTNPGHRPAYAAGVVALDGLLQSGNYSSADFKGVLASLPIKEFQGQNGALLLTGVVTVFDLVTMFGYTIDSAPAVQGVMQAVRDGIAEGLAASQQRAIKAPAQTVRQLLAVRTIRI